MVFPVWEAVLSVVRAIALIAGAVVTVWATAALFYDGGGSMLRIVLAMVYAVTVIALSWRLRTVWIAFAGFVLVLVWWLSLKPSHSRDWQPDVAQLPWGEINGDRATLHNVRNFDYRTETDYVPHWEEKTVDLRGITGLDVFMTDWGVPLIAHAIGSISFADGTHLAMSIEARKEVGEEYSATRGFFRQYELIYLISEERDVVRLRTNFRKDEYVYLYRTRTTPADARRIFEHYVHWMNENRAHAQWYNALTANCSSSFTSFLADNNIGGVSRLNWRTVLIGHADKMLYDLGDLETGGEPFDELRRKAVINSVAKAAGDAPDFSQRIRAGKPGF